MPFCANLRPVLSQSLHKGFSLKPSQQLVGRKGRRDGKRKTALRGNTRRPPIPDFAERNFMESWFGWTRKKIPEPVAALAEREPAERLAALGVESAVAALHAIAGEYRELQTKFGLMCDPAGTILRCAVSNFAQRDALEVQCREIARRHDQALQRFYRACSIYAGTKQQEGGKN
jgi:hypothetical protein